MMLTHYNSSSGAKEIATMPLSYAKNARNKLQRTEPERTAEIEALSAHVEKLEAEAAEKALSGDTVGKDATIGDNGGPALDEEPKVSGREAIETHVADLLSEAANWADGFVIERQEQADAIGRLMRQFQQAAKLVDENAVEEKRPHNDAIAEIGAWQNGYTAKGLKKTPDGKLTKAILACGNMSTAWLRKQDEERRRREQEAAQAAAKAAQEALAAREEAKTTTDLATMDKADDLLADAEALLRQAKGVSKEKVNASGGEGLRAVGLRSNWIATPTGEDGCWNKALAHYSQKPEFREDLKALIQKWADRDARTEATRVRGVPGFTFIDEKVAA